MKITLSTLLCQGIQEKKDEFGRCSIKYIVQLLGSLAKGAGLIVIWPIWSYIQKARCEYGYLTSHGENRVKERKEFLVNNIVSSRAQIIEICSEATFQPLLQLYLLFPKLMCFDYNDLLGVDIGTFFLNVPKLQLYAIVTSCLSLSWSFNVYLASKKTGALDFDANLWGRLVLLASCVCLITSRLFVFVFLAYCFGDGQFYPMVVVVVSHMLLMAAFHWYTTASFNIKSKSLFVFSKRMHNFSQVFYQCLLNGISNIYLYNDIVALPNIMTQEKKTTVQRRSRHLITKWKQPIVDAFLFLESLAIVIISLYCVENLPRQIVIVVMVLHIVGLILKVVYYKTLHIWSGLSLTRCPAKP